MNNTMTRWNPLRELEDFRNRVLSAFNPESQRSNNGHETITHSEWMPLVDISENEEGYYVTAELPDVKKEDVKVTLENGILTIAGERQFREENGMRWHRVERPYGSFSRSFALPDKGDPEKVNAEFSNGILKVKVAKSEAAKPRQIEVKVN